MAKEIQAKIRGNANQDNNEISPHTTENGIYQRDF